MNTKFFRLLLTLTLVGVALVGCGPKLEWDELRLAQSPPARMGHAMAYDAKNKVVVLFGGSDCKSTNSLQDTWIWDGKKWEEIKPARSPPARQVHAMAYDGQQIVLFGGTERLATDFSPIALLSDTWVLKLEWDRTTSTWKATWNEVTPAVPIPARFAHGLAYDADRNKVVLFGGGVPMGTWLNDTWEGKWDSRTSTWTWTYVQTPGNLSPPDERMLHVMVYDYGLKHVLLAGGASRQPGTRYAKAKTMDTLWWYGTDWGAREGLPINSPSARTNHAMASDSDNKCIVLFGGSDGSKILNDTWIGGWDGKYWEWKTFTLPKSPPARSGHAMAYDDKNKVVVLFGGLDAKRQKCLDDTWTFSY